MSSIIEMYKLDIADLENLISQSKRSNIQRQLTEYKNNLQKLLNDEEKKLTASKEQTTDEKKMSLLKKNLNYHLLQFQIMHQIQVMKILLNYMLQVVFQK